MGPSRKKPRTNAPLPPPPLDKSGDPTTLTSQAAAEEVKNTATQIPLPNTPSNGSASNPLEDVHTPLKSTKAETGKNLKSRASWYGSWPRKSTASTQIARESILADKTVTPSSSTDLSRYEPPRPPPASLNRPPSMSVGKSKETTDITMGGTSDTTQNQQLGTKKQPSIKSSAKSSSVKESENSESIPILDGNKDSSPQPQIEATPSQPEGSTNDELPQRPTTASGWLGSWLGRPVVQPTSSIASPVETKPADDPVTTEEAQVPEASVETVAVPAENAQHVEQVPASTSWFGLWSRAGPSVAEKAEEPQVPVVTTMPDEDTPMIDVTEPTVTKPVPGSSWAFWSTENPKPDEPKPQPDKGQGELAVVGNTSESKPEPAVATVVKESKTSKSAKKAKTATTEVVDSPRKVEQAEPIPGKSTPSRTSTPVKSIPANLLLPSVKGTYRLVENPSILQQIARLLLKGKQTPTKHVFLSKDVPKIKNALAIGIHGLFPAPLLRTVIGQPTGTSIRFANHAAEAIRRWTDSHGFVDCEIEKVALEGEGKIADRVENLWKLLLNWIDHVRKADFILIGCHSQGVPVAIMLVAKLVEFGVISTAKIGICAMAGVSLGPFSDYKSRLFSGSAGELFEFANPESVVSKRYEESLKVVLKYGTKITYCGSIDDQLVSLESSIFSTVSHPHIFRVVFVDGRIHAPDFLAHLVGFALKLRNLGVSDHGLIRELSAPLAGSLYTGEGHSRLYDDGKVYDLAVEFALETTSVVDNPLQVTKYEIPSNANPYVLPWIMRGLLEEDFVKTELDTETTELLEQFDDWKPSTKVLKDVKYRLEAVKSKL